jgi:hypothetical protein
MRRAERAVLGGVNVGRFTHEIVVYPRGMGSEVLISIGISVIPASLDEDGARAPAAAPAEILRTLDTADTAAPADLGQGRADAEPRLGQSRAGLVAYRGTLPPARCPEAPGAASPGAYQGQLTAPAGLPFTN